ncbi:MAG: class I SAM-dependent methyltransferase [Armatimonadetes bacterium]|nr:class I SAM-dependent methyltransferase [Armatimonadota bacterium]
MYVRSAAYYDAVYIAGLGKEYAREADQVHALIQQHKRSEGNALLDVACGTGNHLQYLQKHYTVEGLDLSSEMLAIARRKLPDVPFHRADMADFDLGRRFDAVVCLFSAVGSVVTVDRLRRAAGTMSRHLRPGGVVIVEPWITPEAWRDGHLGAIFVDQPDLKIARINLSRREGEVAVLEFHYLIGTPAGIESFTERHDLGLFSHDDYLAAFHVGGLDVAHDPQGLIGRGLYIGLKPC